jgi:hypothetical protein
MSEKGAPIEKPGCGMCLRANWSLTTKISADTARTAPKSSFFLDQKNAIIIPYPF